MTVAGQKICKDLDLAGLVIQSLNKAGYHQTPNMSNLSGSARVSYDADAIAILSEDTNEPNVVNLIWEKMRESDGNRVLKLVKTQGFPAFGEYAKEYSEPIRDWTK